MAIAFAVSTTRSMSACVTSFSLIATMPLELRLRMCPPAMPVYTSVIEQSAINSASSSTRWIDAMVASMLTTTPFFKPREGCVPRPMMLSCFSGVTSATITTIFDVPTSSPTMRFLASLTMPSSSLALSSASIRPHLFRRFPQPPHGRRKTVAVAQIDPAYVFPGALQAAYRARVVADEARQALARLDATEFDGHRDASGIHAPAAAGGQPDFGNRKVGRLEHLAEFAKTRGNLLRSALGTDELRQLPVEVRAEDVAARVDQGAIVPARQRLVLGDADFEPSGPEPAQRHVAYPRNSRERGAGIGELHGEEGAPELFSDHRLQERRIRPQEGLLDHDL